MSSTHRDAARSSPRDESTGELVGGLLTDAKDLISAHVDHLELEFRTEVGALSETVKRTGVAIAAFVVVGVLVGQALASGLTAATGWPPWATLGLVGALVAVVGLRIYRRRPAPVDLVPRTAMNAIERDVERVIDATAES